MPWTGWQKVESEAHMQFPDKPDFDDLNDWVAKRFALDPKETVGMTNLVFIDWDTFENLSEPETT